MQIDRKRLLGWGRDSLFLVAALAAVHVFTTRNVARGPAPAIDGTSPSGAPLSLASLRGKPVLVHFWATWCPVCKQEEGSIASLAEDHAVLSVAVDSGLPSEVASYLRARGVALPTVVDSEHRIAAAYGVDRFPTSFVLDGQGRIRFVEVGYTTAIGLRLRMWLAGL